jgi:hypothetical protein
MRHKPRHIALLSTLALLALGVSASAANATILNEWKVKGTTLKTGETKPLTIKDKAKSSITFKMSNGEFNGKFTSTEVKFREGGGGIAGGKPGQLNGTLQFSKVVGSGTLGEGCEALIKEGEPGILTTGLSGEIVESAVEGKGTGKTEIVFKPKAGADLLEIEFKRVSGGEGCYWGAGHVVATGSLLAELSPQKTEAKIGQLLLGTAASKFGSEYRNAAGEFKKAEMVSGSTYMWEVTGEPEIELVSKEVFGAF